ncbi:MAG TPA: type II toxin-antitoxin system VapC family toxin [Oceanithermus profundus]|uniref:Ribonuclease VapC n=1 Tax=Oceanithermus profundus TaxID=187137 RepID=A0A7C4VFV5_9DEIN|nr:type II toxin-antitoxin system VapC family toxin [Oceanithermus profundus]
MAALIVDANVLLRLITREPRGMYEAARNFLLELEEDGEKAAVHPVHAAEVIYVLEGELYGLAPAEAAGELLTLLEGRVFAPVEEPALLRALAAYPGSGLDFPDVFLLAWAREHGLRALSFDRKLASKYPDITVPG